MARWSIGFLTLYLLVAAGCSHSPNYYIERGNKLYTAGKAEAASLEYRKALQKDPKSGEAYYRLGLSQIAEKKLQDAYQSLSRAVELMPANDDAKARLGDVAMEGYIVDPRQAGLYNQASKIADGLLAKDTNSFDGLRIKGSLALSERKVQEAIAYLRKADQVKPMDPDVIVALSQALFLDNKSEEGEKLAQGLIEKSKAFGPIYDILYRHYTAANRPDAAEKILQAKAANNPSSSAYVLELAYYYARERRRPETDSTLNRLLDNPKDFPDAHLLVGDFYSGLGDWSAAIAQFDAGARSNPKDALPYEKRKLRALFAEGKKPDGDELLQKILKSHPKDPDARAVQAALLFESGKPENVDKALAEFQALVKDKPDDPALHYNFGRVQLAKGNVEAARTEFLQAVRQHRNYTAPRFALANISMNQQKPADALRYANEILSYDANNLQAQQVRVAALQHMGNYNEARAQLTQLLKQDPRSEDAQIQLGAIALAQKKFKEAEDIFERLRGSGKSDAKAVAGLAETYMAEGRLEKAMTLLTDELKKSPDSDPLRILLASTATNAGRYDTAIAEYKQVLDKNPRSAIACLRLGDTYRRKGNIDAAIAAFRQAKRLAPKDPAPSLALADTLAVNGRAAEAVPEYRDLLHQYPNDPALENSLAFALSESSGDIDEALRLAQSAAQKIPGQQDFADTLGYIYLKKGMNSSALQIFQKLVKQNPNSSTFRYHLGLALFEKGDKQAARTELLQARAHQPPPVEAQKITELIAKLN